MSQGPILIISDGANTALKNAVVTLKNFPLIDTDWTSASDAISRVQPAAILAANIGAKEATLSAIAKQTEAFRPYVPIVALDPVDTLPANVLPFMLANRDPKHLVARLNAALRVRAMHMTLLRRLADASAPHIPTGDPLQDSTILLIGRGGSFPALSVALGERVGVVGALSIEAAAKHLNAREIDGVVVGEGFSGRVLDAFLTVLSEDARFRNLPVILAGATGMIADYDLPNLEMSFGDPAALAASALPLIRQHAFEARIQRALKSIDAGGLLDPRTGLLTVEAFNRDLSAAVTETQSRGAGLALARISFGSASERTRLDAARIFGRLLRRMDFATLDGNDAIVVAFAETELRNARMIAKRLTSVLKHTVVSGKEEPRLEPDVVVAGLLPTDSTDTLLSRLHQDSRRAAS